MDNISELKKILGGFLHWNKAGLDCFSRLLVALFAVRTVNLKEIAVALSGLAQMESRYKRLKRFLRNLKLINLLFLNRFLNYSFRVNLKCI